jgi:hypothetical protein
LLNSCEGEISSGYSILVGKPLGKSKMEGDGNIKIEEYIFWDITPCSPLKVNRTLFATCFQAVFLLGLFFDPEDKGDMFLRNVG